MIRKLFGIDIRKLSWLERLWLLAPVVMWFSYRPLVQLAQDQTAYYELSIVLVYLCILAIAGLPHIWRARRYLRTSKSFWLVGAFASLSLVSVVWTPNPPRGVLTAGLVCLLFFGFAAILAKQDMFQKLLPLLTKLLIGSAVIVSVLAFVQVIAGLWLSREDAFLCAGCVADQFGFVRANVFAIEPQFLGSLLIAPLLVLFQKMLSSNDWRNWRVIASSICIAAALFLTLSRGAIFAFAIGFIVLLLVRYKQWRRGVFACVLLVVAFLFALTTQGFSASLNPRVEVSFTAAVSASLNQLSLGLIDLPAADQASHTAPITHENVPTYTGYVEESTTIRLSLSQIALRTWMLDAIRMLVGVGVGGAGVAMHAAYPEQIGSREIVQNQYAEILLEYGLVGLVLFVVVLAGFFYATRQHKWAWAVAIAYMVQWWFFSGYPNALHIYFVLAALYGAFSTNRKVTNPFGK